MKMQLGRASVAVILLFSTAALVLNAQPASEKFLWQPFFVDARSGEQHLSLDGDWELGSRDAGITAVNQLQQQRWIKAEVPTSVQWALYEAGELPYPYAHMNTQKYKWVPDKVWYFRRHFEVSATVKDDYVFLCFDGAGYHTKIWLNGSLVGRHQGMFGGPHVEVSQWLQSGRQNEIVVEVKAGSYGEKTWDPDNYGNGKTAEPWGVNGGQKNVTGGSSIDPKEIEPLGLWQSVRLEITPKVHLARPFLVTEKTSGSAASLQLKVEVLAETTALDTDIQNEFGSHRDSAIALTEQKDLSLEMELVEKGTSRVASKKVWPVKALQGRNWLDEKIQVPNPKLWWPNGMGDANLYRVHLTLLRQNKPIDRLEFDYGIRTIERVPTPGPKTQDRWENWQFIVNGRPLFVKGMNWAWPLDVLLHLPADRYQLVLAQAQAAHIQMLRVWGGGNTETDEFFRLCDKLGIMVWEDFPLANADAPNLPQDVWEAQVMHTIFRLRNHSSLAVWCGGNEFNPYDAGNSAAVGIVERSVRDFDGTRMFVRTTPDPGDVHIYNDQDPTWYGHRYKSVPFISETGIYNMPDADSILEVVDENELKGQFNTVFDKGYAEKHPEFIHHFLEYGGGEPRLMWARAYQVDDLSKVDLKRFSGSSQMAASEFTQILSDLTQANYPATAGLMPWSFTVPWPIEFFMFVDGLNQPTSSYYTIKRTYEPTHVVVKLPELLWAKGEKIPISVAVVHSPVAALPGVNVSVQILDAQFHSLWSKTQPINVPAGPSAKSMEMGAFTIPDNLEDKFFFVVAEAKSADGKMLSRSVYWPRCLKLMNDAAFRTKYRGSPQPSLKFETGPWLRPQVAATPTDLALKVISRKDVNDTESVVRVEVRNTGNNPAFETHVNIAGTKRTFWGTDNDLWMTAGEVKTIDLNVQWKDAAAKDGASVTVDAWNAELKQALLPAAR